MKIRIKGDSIRLRLTKSEVDRLATTGHIEERTSFAEQNEFIYSISARGERDIAASFSSTGIHIGITQEECTKWANSDQVGIDKLIDLSNGSSLRVLIEKDFTCMINRPNEDESDHYPNPLEQNRT